MKLLPPQHVRRVARLGVWLLAMAASPWVGCQTLSAGEPVAMRIEPLTLAPPHKPNAVVVVRNDKGSAYEGVLRLRGPEGWLLTPPQESVSLKAGEAKRVVFTAQQGTIRETNSYPLEAVAESGGAAVTHRQNVACFSAPNLKPAIDGKTDDWKDAIPFTWLSGGKKTTISTCWNRRQFAMLVAVEEEHLKAHRANEPPEACDAVQIALSPESAPTGTSPDQPAGRHEFLVVATDEHSGRIFQFAEPTAKLGSTMDAQRLDRPVEKAEVAVSRKEGTTYYEVAIPFKAIPEIRASEGREFCLSILVHDPDGVGIRDLGEAAGLWPSERNRLAWSDWPGAKWSRQPPYDNKLPWGLCSSKY